MIPKGTMRPLKKVLGGLFGLVGVGLVFGIDMINNIVSNYEMVFGIILVSMSLISAGWFSDLFTFGDDDGGLEGELAETANVGVIISGTYPAPEIVYISDLNSKTEVTIVNTDREAIEIALKSTYNLPGIKPTIILIRNTLKLDEMFVSENIWEKIKNNISTIGNWKKLTFDDIGNLTLRV